MFIIADITTQSWREKTLVIPASVAFDVAMIDSQPNYVNIYNYSNNQIYVSRAGASVTQYEFTVPPLSNRQWCWSSPFSDLSFFQGGPGGASIKLTTYSATFDPSAVAQTGQNVVIASALNVASMPVMKIDSISQVLNVQPIPSAVYYPVGSFFPLLGGGTPLTLLGGLPGNLILEAHFDFKNYDTVGRVAFLTIDPPVGTYARFLAPLLPPGGSHFDLTFGNGVDIMNGIFAEGEVANMIKVVGGYIIGQVPK